MKYLKGYEMAKLIKNISSLVTVQANGKKYKVGKEMQDIAEISDGAIIFDQRIVFVGTTSEAKKEIVNNNIQIDEIIDATGNTVLPGFVDSHTHIVFGGNRSEEFARRLRGITYQQIAKEGGGILTTVKGTRQSSLEELVAKGMQLANSAMKYGTTAIEIKSGYGLNLESEIRQLEAIKQLKSNLDMHIAATFLGAHDIPPEYKSRHFPEIDDKSLSPTPNKLGVRDYPALFLIFRMSFL